MGEIKGFDTLSCKTHAIGKLTGLSLRLAGQCKTFGETNWTEGK
jgi:hypothetical protein